MKLSPKVEPYRVRTGYYASPTGAAWGAFFITGPCGMTLKIVASDGDAEIGIEWEHVSVSTRNRCPNWLEMCFVKDLFWDEEEAVMQLHPPKSRWINNHEFCLHLFRPTGAGVEIPLPPDMTVGVKELGVLG